MIDITPEMIKAWETEAIQWRGDKTINPEDASEFDVMIEQLAAGHLGTKQPESIAAALEIELTGDEEFAWEEIEEVTQQHGRTQASGVWFAGHAANRVNSLEVNSVVAGHNACGIVGVVVALIREDIPVNEFADHQVTVRISVE